MLAMLNLHVWRSGRLVDWFGVGYLPTALCDNVVGSRVHIGQMKVSW
jgi:hypothetical protein